MDFSSFHSCSPCAFAGSVARRLGEGYQENQLCALPTASMFCVGGDNGLDGVEFVGNLLILSERPVAVTSLRTVRGTPLSSVPSGNYRK